jgi:polycomb protein SUZ12
LAAPPKTPPENGVAGGGQIIYNFLYHNNSLQQTEARGDMRCPWCSLSCRKLYSLLKHMSLCHPRFLFTYTPMEGGSIIDVHVNKLYGAGQVSVGRDPVERSGMNLRQRWKGPLKCLPCTATLVERHEGLVEDMSEFLNDGSWKRGYNVKRQYYHSSTCLPMVPEEIDADSEAELESIGRWQKICSQKAYTHKHRAKDQCIIQ